MKSMPKSKINPEKYKDLVSTNKNLVADYRPLNFDSLLARKALRVTHQGISDEEYNPDPKAGFSLVSAYNDAIGKGEGTNKWKDNPDMYPVVRKMLQNSPENIGAHKYLQIVESAKDLGLSDDEIYMPVSSTEYSKGGSVKKAKKQMQRLFQDGGMLQEGGTVDENSGNEVPVGSLKKEVRDDIPAQLSEGEFVFPADVVRFIGLERLMQMRQAAKNGLAKMDAMGQMGNADEATEEDTGEFETEIDGIIEEVENQSKKSEEGQLKFQSGGAVPSMAYQMRRFGKEGERDIYIPFMGDTPQLDIPEGFTQTSKVVSKGGVYRDPSEAQPLLSSIRQPGQFGKASTITGTVTQQPLVTMDPTYAGLDVDTDMNRYLLSLAEKDATKYAPENKAKNRAWGPGMILDNPFKDLKDFGTSEVQTGVDTDGVPIMETVQNDAYWANPYRAWLQTDAAKDKPGSSFMYDILNHKTTAVQKIEQNGDIYYQISGKTGGDDRERMSQVYKEIDDKLVPVGKASFYTGEHPDAKTAGTFVQFAAMAAAPFTAGWSTAIGEFVLGAGAVGAQTVGSAIIGATVNGISAAAVGGDVKKAVLSGAATGAINANAGDITNAILGADTVNSIASAINLKPAQVSNIFANSIGSGVIKVVQGGDLSDFLTSFKDTLITTGVSEVAAANVMKSLSGTVNTDTIRRIGSITKMASNVAINASMKNLDPAKALQMYMPTIVTRALTIPGGG
jgi:hypothetical protein